ncbi:MAG TPA: helix-turn-helix domain-containing protein, partial [Verrucomicrobiae bacterium]|nr:helix-turn-helix domain-containing protein [Verrucomicrobiae bacterium]
RRQAQAARREQLLDEFERSGLSAAEFARQHGLTYTTFCGWRKRWERGKALPSFVQVEVAPCAEAEGLVIEAGAQVRMTVASTK